MNTFWSIWSHRLLTYYKMVRSYDIQLEHDPALLTHGDIQRLLMEGQNLFFEVESDPVLWAKYEIYYQFYIFLDKLLNNTLGVEPMNINQRVIEQREFAILIDSFNRWLKKYNLDVYERFHQTTEIVEMTLKSEGGVESMLAHMVAKQVRKNATARYDKYRSETSVLVLKPMASLNLHDLEYERSDENLTTRIKLPLEIKNHGPDQATGIEIKATVNNRPIMRQPVKIMHLLDQQSQVVMIEFSHRHSEICDVEIRTTFYNYIDNSRQINYNDPIFIKLVGWRTISGEHFDIVVVSNTEAEEHFFQATYQSKYNETIENLKRGKSLLVLSGARKFGKSKFVAKLKTDPNISNLFDEVEIMDCDLENVTTKTFVISLLTSKGVPLTKAQTDNPWKSLHMWLSNLKEQNSGKTPLLLVLDHAQLLPQRMSTIGFKELMEEFHTLMQAHNVKVIWMEDYSYLPFKSLPVLSEMVQDIEEDLIASIHIPMLDESQSVSLAEGFLCYSDNQEPKEINYDHMAAAWLYRLTGGHPTLIYMLCRALTMTKPLFFDGLISVVDLKIAVRFLLQDEAMLQTLDILIKSYGETEYQFLQWLIQTNAIDPQTNRIRSWVNQREKEVSRFNRAWKIYADNEKIQPLSLDVLKQSLLQKDLIGYRTHDHLIYSEEYAGTPRLRIGLFYLYLHQQLDVTAPVPVLAG